MLGVIVAVTVTLPYFGLDLALRKLEELHLIPKTKLGIELPCTFSTADICVRTEFLIEENRGNSLLRFRYLFLISSMSSFSCPKIGQN